MNINKLLIISLIIVIAAASASYFGGTPILTGKATGAVTKISVSPTYITAESDRKITITIEPGEGGFSSTAYFYRYTGSRGTEGARVATKERLCVGSITCKNKIIFDYSLITVDKGNYYVTVLDRKTNEKVKAYFTVEALKEELPREKLNQDLSNVIGGAY